MIRVNLIKRSILQGVPIINSSVLGFHLTSKTLVRGALSKDRHNDVEKHLEKESDHLISNESNEDFLGIESEEGVITISSNVNSIQQNVLKRKLKEKFYRASFGVIRYDSDNKLKFHGQFGKADNMIFPQNSNDYSEVSVNLTKVKSSGNPVLNNFEVNRFDSSITSSKICEDNNSYNTVALNNVCSGPHESVKHDTDVINNVYSEPYESVKHDHDASYIDQYYFNNSSNRREHLVENINDPPSVSEELNFIDENYFENLTDSENKKLSQKQDFSQNALLVKEVVTKCNDKNFSENLKIDNNEDKKRNSLKNNSETSIKYSERDDILEDFIQANTIDTSDRKHESSISSKNIIAKQFDTEIHDVNMKSDALFSNANYNLPLKERNSMPGSSTKLKLNEPLSDKIIQVNYHPKAEKLSVSMKGLKDSNISTKESAIDVTDRTTAYDFVKDLQKQKNIPECNVKKGSSILDIKVDSKGFRILKNQVDDLSYFTRDEIITLLKQNILYSDDDLLVLNKPYSLVMHESQTTKFPCLSAFLDELADEVNQQTDEPKLYTVHRLDKETTGCLLLAKNETMAQHLKSLFAQRKIIKKYWILTSRVPDPPEGVIDIPIAEGSIDNKKRMVLHPEIPKDLAYRNHSKRGKPAVTSYKVLSESYNAALVEATPLTGIKHQIRVHFGFGLCCPILGDHKYSHLDKLAPQKLPSDILQRLHVRQSKVRYIPLHIHAKSVTIPEYFEGRDLYVKAPLPNHMKENLRRLKFRK